mmetsp:Transcript_30592/g.60024  ORF Transcript_30592/g.60024 Transcript_30592/m.60024 type:complete len:236 (-) Transcript_30592:53-760(-)
MATRLLTIPFAPLICFLCVVAQGSDVVTLTAANFDEVVGEGAKTPWFVSFQAPWCGHCKALAPIWEKLASQLKGRVNVAKVDGISEGSLTKQWKIKEFPALRLVANGKVYAFTGRRNLDDLQAWAQGLFIFETAEEMPKELRLIDRFLEKTWHFAWTFAMPVGIAASIGVVVWLFRSKPPTEEEIQRRRAFEEKMALYEKRARERHAKSLAAQQGKAEPAPCSTDQESEDTKKAK